MAKWIVFQVGSREHYALPRMFHSHRELFALVTDVWIPRNRILKKLAPSIVSRYHSDLASAKIVHWNTFFIIIDLLRKISFFKKIINRDKLSQLLFVRYLKTIPRNEKVIIFSYNYVAQDLFVNAQKMGFTCILGQIDAGPLAGEINRMLYSQTFNGKILPNPDLYITYRTAWLKECELAKYIIVNSEWSKQMLINAGIDLEKLKVIALAYTAPKEALNFNRKYPNQFNNERPLRILYLGSLKLLKGIEPLLKAIRMLENKPIEFFLVGSRQIPDYMLHNLKNNCIITGAVSKQKTNEYYQNCDLLILPTYSDGFAMTQLEAQAWKMPIIASERCGKVVDHNINGLVLKEITFEEIVKSINLVLENPLLLKQFSEKSISLMDYSLNTIYHKYAALIE